MSDTFGALIGAEIKERREAAAMTQRELAAESFPDADLDSMERRIREIEAGTYANPRAKTYQPICDTLNITRADIRAMKAEASDARAQQEAERQEFEEDSGPVRQALENPEGLTRAQLMYLAELFGFAEPEKASDTALRGFLTDKATEYRDYKKLIDGLDERVAAIANLKGAAQDAAERLDFDEVETLLARVDEVETTIAAETKEARASNALLRNRPEQAYAIFCSAADAFRELDVREYARRRDNYLQQLFNHALRYGGPGLALAADMIRPAIAALAGTEHREDWAAYTQNLAIALETQGSRTAGPAGAALLAEAVTAYRAALDVFTRDDHPVDWAMTQENMAVLELAWADQGSAVDPVAHLRAASDHVDKALAIYDPDHMAYDHGRATALRDLIEARLKEVE